jgi:hypothetical protein
MIQLKADTGSLPAEMQAAVAAAAPDQARYVSCVPTVLTRRGSPAARVP